MVREHVDENGKFKSDKYPWCKEDFVPLKLTDPNARKVLLLYADLREDIDPAFSADLRFCIAEAEKDDLRSCITRSERLLHNTEQPW